MKQYIDNPWRQLEKITQDFLHQSPSNDPCKDCPNNPKNNRFATGFCNCTLPYFANPIY